MIKINGISTYKGGKGGAGTYQAIINEIRPYDILFIPFLGNCAISRALNHAGSTVIGIDMDPAVISAWKEMDFPWIKVLEGDGLEWIMRVPTNFTLGSRIVIYCDPPYPLSTRSCQKDLYKHEFTDQDHERLLRQLVLLNSIKRSDTQIDILVSTYPNKLYMNTLKSSAGWRLKEFQSTTRRGRATEWLFMNYDNPEGVLQDYQYVGDDYRDRERITRKRRRWVNRINRMEARERNAILYDLTQIG